MSTPASESEDAQPEGTSRASVRDEKVAGHSRSLRDLEQATNLLLSELRVVRKALTQRPTRTEEAVKRRGAAMALAAFILLSMQVQDIHVEACGPGARSQAGISYTAKTSVEEFDRSKMQRLLDSPVPGICDITSPLHSHDSDRFWPTGENLAGLLIYLLLGILGYVWYRVPLWRERIGRHGDPADPPPPPWDGKERRTKADK